MVVSIHAADWVWRCSGTIAKYKKMGAIHTRVNTHRGWQAGRMPGGKGIKHAESYTIRYPIILKDKLRTIALLPQSREMLVAGRRQKQDVGAMICNHLHQLFNPVSECCYTAGDPGTQ